MLRFATRARPRTLSTAVPRVLTYGAFEELGCLTRERPIGKAIHQACLVPRDGGLREQWVHHLARRIVWDVVLRDALF